MSHRLMTLTALALTLAGTSACDDEAAFGAGDGVALRPNGSGGILLNTSATGEWAVDHLDTNFGADLDGLSVKSVTLLSKMEKGMTIKLVSWWAENGQLVGKSAYGFHKGDEFVGAVIDFETAKAPGATSRKMTISAHSIDTAGFHRYVFMYPNDPTYGTHIYTLQGGSGKYGEKNEEKPPQSLAVCAPDPETGGSIEAFVFSDIYVDMKGGQFKDRPDTIMIGCISGGVGKAGGIYGFAPFGIEAHEGATRMTRADYCGNGDSYTKPGNAFYERDVFGLHDWGAGAGNVTEAVWTREGAACIDTPRDPSFGYNDVDCGGWTPEYCKDRGTDDYAGAMMHSKAP